MNSKSPREQANKSLELKNAGMNFHCAIVQTSDGPDGGCPWRRLSQSHGSDDVCGKSGGGQERGGGQVQSDGHVSVVSVADCLSTRESLSP